jgi:hypothetical protein
MAYFSAANYLGSHPGYSWLGQIITWGSVPWAVLISVLLPVSAAGWIGWVSWLLIFPPFAVWFIGKVAGPDRVSWFYRRPGTCSFSDEGVTWHTEMPFARIRKVAVPWADIVWVEHGYVHLSVIGRSRSIVTRVPADISRLRQLGLPEDWSFAQALVSYRPDQYVTTDPVVHGQPSGARLREPHEPESKVTPILLSRAQPVVMALFICFVFVTSVVEALLRNR